MREQSSRISLLEQENRKLLLKQPETNLQDKEGGKEGENEVVHHMINHWFHKKLDEMDQEIHDLFILENSDVSVRNVQFEKVNYYLGVLTFYSSPYGQHQDQFQA